MILLRFVDKYKELDRSGVTDEAELLQQAAEALKQDGVQLTSLADEAKVRAKWAYLMSYWRT